jgi:hypothetical protein
MKNLIILFLLITCSLCYGQKYMIRDKDTSLYKDSMVITHDTTHNGSATFVKTDTTYEGACRTFEKISGRIVNQTDDRCYAQGTWVEKDSTGNYTTGNYLDNIKRGIWKSFYFNKDKKLIRETESVYLGDKLYVVKEVYYVNGVGVVVTSRPILKFFILLNQPVLALESNCFGILVFVLVISALARILINNSIYNLENETNFSAVGNRFKIKLFEEGELEHKLLCVFTLWFFKYKPENKSSVFISNLLGCIFFGALLLLIIEGMLCDLKPS